MEKSEGGKEASAILIIPKKNNPPWGGEQNEGSVWGLEGESFHRRSNTEGAGRRSHRLKKVPF